MARTPKKNPDTQEVINRDINAGQRAAQALKLRASKLTYDEIARKCGYANPGACRKAVLREMNRTIVKNVEELRSEQLNELDRLQQIAWKLADNEANDYRLYAVDRVLAIMERRSKLMGLDQTPDMAAAVAQVVIREVPAGYLGLEPAREVQA